MKCHIVIDFGIKQNKKQMEQKDQAGGQEKDIGGQFVIFQIKILQEVLISTQQEEYWRGLSILLLIG